MNVGNIAKQSGAVVIGPVGMGNINYPILPALFKGVMSIASTDKTDKKTSDSDYGRWVALCAPGAPLTSKHFAKLGMESIRSTIFSAALVAGAAALVRSAKPGLEQS